MYPHALHSDTEKWLFGKVILINVSYKEQNLNINVSYKKHVVDIRSLREVVAESLSASIPDVFDRDIDVNIKLNKVIVIAGIRRCGKTYELYNIMNKLMQMGVSRDNLLYINFEDERLRGLNIKQLNDIIHLYHELANPSKNQIIYLFFDELQNIDGWPQWVRRLYDSNLYRLFITGSSSKLLSYEIATALAGRNVTYNIYPYSLKEFLNAKNVKTSKKEKYSSIGNFNKYISEYIKLGGFPEVSMILSINDKIRVLSSYYDAIVYRDVIDRYKVRNVNALSMTFRYAITTYAKEFSSTKTYNYFKSTGIDISKKTINSFIKYGESVFLYYLLYKFSKSFKKSYQSRKKIYITDPGLLMLYEKGEDSGRLLENAVCIELLRRKEKDPLLDIYYLKEDYGEVDFVITKQGTVRDLIQVTYELSESDKKREIEPLIYACEEFNINSAKIITFDGEDTIKTDNKTIQILPFAEWQYL